VADITSLTQRPVGGVRLRQRRDSPVHSPSGTWHRRMAVSCAEERLPKVCSGGRITAVVPSPTSSDRWRGDLVSVTSCAVVDGCRRRFMSARPRPSSAAPSV